MAQDIGTGLDPSLFGLIVDRAPDSIVLVDPSGRIVFANQQTEALSGYRPDELIGKTVEFLVPERVRARHIGHQATYHAHPTTRPMGSGLELAVLRKDGTELPVEISLSPLHTSGGLYVTAIIRDVLERKTLEDIRRRVEERYRLLAEHARDMIYRIRLLPPPARIDYISPAARVLTGFAPEDYYADPDLLVNITNPEHRPLLERLMTEPDTVPNPFLLQAHRRDGAVVWLEQQFSVIRDDEGRPGAIEGIARDTTARILGEEERQRLRAQTDLQEERERISRDLHDGVMQAIYGVGLNLTDLRTRLEPVSEDASQTVAGAISDLRGVIADIRSYVMGLPLERAGGEVGPLLSNVLNDFRAQSAIAAELNVDPAIGVLTDGQRLTLFHVTQEALANVQKHADAGYVSVRVRLDETGDLLLEIHDDGQGFDPAQEVGREHMGLRNMRARAEQVGGRLEVDASPGAGTRVKLSLPRPQWP